MVKDVLIRLQMPLDKCRGQCYDGCSTVSDHKNGVAAEGGARKSVRTPSSNIVEFKMKIKNLFSKLKSDFKEKRYDGLKKGA